jgi:hypothetical protein
VDFKTDVFTSLSDRPPIATFQPWAFGTLKALRSHPCVDAKKAYRHYGIFVTGNAKITPYGKRKITPLTERG